MKRLAYIRVSTAEQRPDRQIDGLQDKCDKLFIETVSAVSKARPVYEEVIGQLKPKDVFVIWDLDRAYRSTRDALSELDRLKSRDVSVHIANLNIDTATPHGMLIYTIVSALAEHERSLLSQRTKEGLAAAKSRGQRLGRPPKISDEQVRDAARLLRQKKVTKSEIASRYDIDKWTLTRRLRIYTDC